MKLRPRPPIGEGRKPLAKVPVALDQVIGQHRHRRVLNTRPPDRGPIRNWIASFIEPGENLYFLGSEPSIPSGTAESVAPPPEDCNGYTLPSADRKPQQETRSFSAYGRKHAMAHFRGEFPPAGQ